MSISASQNSDSAPAKRPPLVDMHADTSGLHDAVDRTIREHGVPYLHPLGETVQLDLLGSPNVIDWQEGKQQMMFLGENCWSQLPQLYARYGTTVTGKLIEAVKKLERAKGVILTDCGMQACALLFDILMAPGGHAIMTQQAYNKTRKYLDWICTRVGGQLTVVPDGDYAAIENAIRDTTCFIFTETFTNPSMRAVDPDRLGQVAKQTRAKGRTKLRIIVDNTIASPWAFKKPLLGYEGVDFVVASGTKSLGGQDRDLWGYIATNRIDPLNELMDLQATRGGALDWRRGAAILEGLELAPERYRKRCSSAREVASFLTGHPRISEVFHPSCENHPDRNAVDTHYCETGSLMSFRVKDLTEDATRHFCDVLASSTVVRYALSFDGLVTRVNHHRTVSEYFTPEKELCDLGLDRLVRLGVGLEHPADIIACLNWALWNHDKLSTEDLDQWRAERKTELGC